MFDNSGLYFNSLKQFGPGRGYYLKLLKIFLIMHLDILAARKEFGLRRGFKFCIGARYLSGFIGDDKSKRYWLKYQTSKWEGKIRAITELAGKYPQESYATLVHAIQPE